jgi:hypothetical protein
MKGGSLIRQARRRTLSVRLGFVIMPEPGWDGVGVLCIDERLMSAGFNVEV